MTLRKFSNENFSDKKKKVESKEVISGTIVSNSSSALQLQGTAAQTENLLEVKNSGNNEVTSISNTGIVKANIFQDTEDLLSEAVLWLDAAYSGGGQTIRNLGYGGRQLDAQNGSTTGQDSNDAQYLDWDGINYVYLPGSNANSMGVPDEAALDITGDIDLRAHVAMDDWTPSVTSSIIGKLTALGDQRSYWFNVQTSGDITFIWSETGTFDTLRSATSTIAPAVSDGQALWVRVTLDVDNGASGRDIKFFTSNDGISWVQLGSTVTQANTTSIYSSTSPLQIGTRGDNGNPVVGKFYRAQVFDGIEENGGTKVLDIDTSKITSGSNTSFNALTGQVVTINRSTSGRKSVAVVSPIWLFGTDDYMEVANDALINFGAADSFTVLAIARNWNRTLINRPYLAKRTANVLAATESGWTVGNNQTLATTRIGDGTNTVSRDLTNVTAGEIEVLAVVRNKADSSLVLFRNSSPTAPVTDTTGDLSNSEVMRVGRLSGAGTSYIDMEFIAAAVFRRALTANEITALTTYYQARLS
jgi:hypothetical protein